MTFIIIFEAINYEKIYIRIEKTLLVLTNLNKNKLQTDLPDFAIGSGKNVISTIIIKGNLGTF